nr:PREDICTED: SCAN domain-containing protein 1 [Anolis carolinensis]|eukprot:XP_016853646.1 PREDICTED: SCAN domain-containing protein 1 [Anolis carolinensis]
MGQGCGLQLPGCSAHEQSQRDGGGLCYSPSLHSGFLFLAFRLLDGLCSWPPRFPTLPLRIQRRMDAETKPPAPQSAFTSQHLQKEKGRGSSALMESRVKMEEPNQTSPGGERKSNTLWGRRRVGVPGRMGQDSLEEEDFTSDLHCQRFRRFCYEEALGPREVCSRLHSLCRLWLKPEEHTKAEMLDLFQLFDVVYIVNTLGPQNEL